MDNLVSMALEVNEMVNLKSEHLSEQVLENRDGGDKIKAR